MVVTACPMRLDGTPSRHWKPVRECAGEPHRRLLYRAARLLGVSAPRAQPDQDALSTQIQTVEAAALRDPVAYPLLAALADGIGPRLTGSPADAYRRGVGEGSEIRGYLSAYARRPARRRRTPGGGHAIFDSSGRPAGQAAATEGGLATIEVGTPPAAVAETAGISVVIVATPGPGQVLAGFTADCATGRVLMDADRTCRVVFLPQSSHPPEPGVLRLSGSAFGDVFTYNARTGEHTSQSSDGEGGFAELGGGWSAGWSVFAADFNGDGWTDFFLYSVSTGQWYKAINNGQGFTFYRGQWSAGWQVYVIDFDGDHQSDIFLYNRDGQWFLCLSAGASIDTFTYSAMGTWSPGWQIYPADFNADGKTDLFLYNPTTGWWYRMLFDGVTFQSSPLGQWSPGWSVTIGDFNGDGRSDVLIYNFWAWSGTWYMMLMMADGSFASTPPDAWSGGWTLTPGDFNGDGRTDLLTYSQTSGVWWELISNGDGTFSYYQGPLGGRWSANWRVQATDFNADGRSDLLLYNASSGQWYQAVNTGLGTFSYTTGMWQPGLTIIASGPHTP
jgi:VCBS repeat protein